MKKLWFWAILLSVSFVCVEFFPRDAEAIPAFARKYKTACITCHATFPRLTALGEAIRLNGLKMPEGDELYVKDLPVSMGAEGYKQVFPDAVWPSDIPGMPPISIRIIGDLEWDIGDEASKKDHRNKIEFPHELEILFGGSFGENMSFFGEVELEHPGEEIEGVGGNEIEGPEELGFSGWLMWEDIFVENALNFKVGNVSAREIALPNSRDHDRITQQHYLYRDKVTAGLHGPGLEVNGFGKVWRYAAGWVKPQDDFLDGSPYVQASLKFGGLGYDGSGGTTEEGGLKTTPSGYWRDDSILFGGFYLPGDDNINRYGIDARLNYQDLSLAAGYAKEDNDTGSSLDQKVWFAELEYFVFPWMQAYVRYSVFDDDDDVNDDKDQARFIVGTALLARANVKVNVEGRIYTENDVYDNPSTKKDKDIDDRVFVRLDFAF